MKPYVVDELNNLEDLFCAILGGYPENMEDISLFLQNSPLQKLLSKHDVEQLIQGDAYFSSEVLDAIYALLPVDVKLKNKRIILYPKKLRELNKATSTHAGSRVVNISFSQALTVYNVFFNDKVNAVLVQRAEREKQLAEKEENKQQLLQKQQEEEQKWKEKRLKHYEKHKQAAQIWAEQQEEYKRQKQDKKTKKLPQSKDENKDITKKKEKEAKTAYRRKVLMLTEKKNKEQEQRQLQKHKKSQAMKQKAEKALEVQIQLRNERNTSYNELSDVERLKLDIQREKHKLQARRYRKEHPEKRKSYVKPMSELTPEEQQARREANRRRNEIYRYKNAEKLRKKSKSRRIALKNENPELLKEIDKKNNARLSHKKANQNYYQTHKAEIALKDLENPKTKIYKHRYVIKKRLEKTGPLITSLLQGLIVVKSR